MPNYIKQLQEEKTELRRIADELEEALKGLLSYASSEKYQRTVENPIQTMNPDDIVRRVQDSLSCIYANHSDRSNLIWESEKIDVRNVMEEVL